VPMEHVGQADAQGEERPKAFVVRAPGSGLTERDVADFVAGQVAPYNASKAGLIHLTRALAMEWARHDIRVNAICPGYIETEMVAAIPEDVLKKLLTGVPVGRLGQAREIARAVQFLVDDDAGYITGSVVDVNGGLNM